MLVNIFNVASDNANAKSDNNIKCNYVILIFIHLSDY